MENILLIDTTKGNKIAVADSQIKIAHIVNVKNDKDLLSYYTNELFKSFSPIKILAVNTGPGSFTGIRVGLSIVKAMAFALNLPVIATNSFEILAEELKNCNIELPENPVFVIHSHRNFYYIKDKEIKYLSEDELPDKFLVGEVQENHEGKFYRVGPTLNSFLKVVKRKKSQGEFTPLENLMPLYGKEFIPKRRKKRF